MITPKLFQPLKEDKLSRKELVQFLNNMDPLIRIKYEVENWLINTSFLSGQDRTDDVPHNNIHQTIRHREIVYYNHLFTISRMLEKLGLIKEGESLLYNAKLETRQQKGRWKQLERKSFIGKGI